MLTLEEVRIKDASALTEEEKSFLVEHKTDLNAEEQKKFGFEVSTANQETEEQKKEREAAELKAAEEKVAAAKAEAEATEAARNSAPDLTNAQPIMASAVKGDEGKVVMAAAEAKELYDFKLGAQKKETEDFVKTHVARGAIVASETQKTVEMLMGAHGSTRESLRDLITKLPNNAVVASESGSSEKAGNAITATQQLIEKSNSIVASAVEKNQEVSPSAAMIQARQENAELAKQADEEARN